MINDHIVLRPLYRSDFARGHTFVLAQLTGVGNVTQPMFERMLPPFFAIHIIFKSDLTKLFSLILKYCTRIFVVP